MPNRHYRCLAPRDADPGVPLHSQMLEAERWKSMSFQISLVTPPVEQPIRIEIQASNNIPPSDPPNPKDHWQVMEDRWVTVNTYDLPPGKVSALLSYPYVSERYYRLRITSPVEARLTAEVFCRD